MQKWGIFAAVYAAAALAVGGAWCAAYPVAGAVSWPGGGLAVTTAVVLMFRGRSYTSVTEAVPLVVGGATILIGLITGAAVLAPVPPWFVSAAALAMFAGAIVFGVVAPRRQFTPVQRRIAELTEYTVIALIVPLACWVAGLYSAVRGLGLGSEGGFFKISRQIMLPLELRNSSANACTQA